MRRRSRCFAAPSAGAGSMAWRAPARRWSSLAGRSAWRTYIDAQGEIVQTLRYTTSATLPVGSRKWATSSRRTILAAGSWQVDVTTEAGQQLGTVAFTI